jgi:membrane fusion protein (multidrug efflux system)
MSTRSRHVVVVTTILLLVAGALAARLLPSRKDPVGPRPGSELESLPVQVLTLSPQPLVERLLTTGTVRANEEIEIVGEVAGKVAAIEFHEGSRVGKGDLLLQIDDTQLRAERDRAAYRLALAERNEARQQRLLEEGLTSQEEYDFAQSEQNVLRAELELAEARLVKTQILAPFAGVIGLRQVSLGSYLTPQTVVATLQQVDPVRAHFSIPERYAGRLRPGAEIGFRTRGSERTHRGEIVAVEPRVDLDTRSLTIRARSPNRDGALVAGAFADVELVVERIEGALAVPARAVIPELGGKKVYVVENGTAQPRTVETGLRTEDRVQVTKGLAPGDRVIVTAIQRLRPGLPVSPDEVDG